MSSTMQPRVMQPGRFILNSAMLASAGRTESAAHRC
jgi:hypothetical protein